MVSLPVSLAVMLCAAGGRAVADNVRVVRTPSELKRAMRGSGDAQHVVVAEHLDLTALPVQTTGTGLDVLFTIPPVVRSITGNCTGPPPVGLALESFVPPQCVLQVHSTAFRQTEKNATLWLGGLHIIADRNAPGRAAYPLVELSGFFSDVWFTNATFQATGGLVQGIAATSTKTYVGDSAFRGLRTGLDVAFSLADSEIYSTTAFQGVLFTNLTATETRLRNCIAVPAGIVGVSVTNKCKIYSGLTFRNCTFQGNVGTPVHHEADDVFSDTQIELISDDFPGCSADAASSAPDYDSYREYGDDEEYSECEGGFLERAHKWKDGDRCRAAWLEMYEEANYKCDTREPATESRPLSDMATAQTAWRASDYLDTAKPAFQAIVQGRNAAIAADPAARNALAAADAQAAAAAQQEASTPSHAGDGGAGGDVPTGAIVGGAIGGAALLVLSAMACVLLVVRRRRQQHAPASPSQASSIELERSSRTLRAFTVPVEAHRACTSAEMLTRPPATMASTSAEFVGAKGGHRHLSALLPDGAPDSADASRAQPEEMYMPTSLCALEHQLSTLDLERLRGTLTGTTSGALLLEGILDAMHDTNERFAGRYWVHNHMYRRAGGQGVVQFVQRCQDGAEMAVKFFLTPSGYDRELAYYQDPTLRAILVPVAYFDGNEGGAVRSSSGYVFPPFIVVERGESLSEWVSRVATDLPTTMFVLLQLAEKVEKLHASGLCHRDLKPSNVLWRPTANAWTLMDFGCAAHFGERARLAYSIHYAAPEVILASEAGERDMVVTGALDMWALGIISVELLTGRRVFAPPMTEAMARDQLAGRTPLPWEDPALRGAVHGKLKLLRRSVLKCLERDPTQRPTSRELLGLWNGLFESATGATTADYVMPERRVVL